MQIPVRALLLLAGLGLASVAVLPRPASGQSPSDPPPPRLRLKGEVRARYESLDGQFRAGGAGSDQLLLLRSLALIELRAGGHSLGVELQDSRSYLADSRTPLSTGFVNPLDLLQAHVRLQLPGVPVAGARTDLILGRQTVSLGSRRQIVRLDFPNVIRNYTGVLATTTLPGRDQLHLLAMVPVSQAPTDRVLIGQNHPDTDREQWNRQLWALHYIRQTVAPRLWPRLGGELFLYGLHETDSERFPTPNRTYVTPGFRLMREPVRGGWDLDLEGALRFGQRRASSSPGDSVELDVRASTLRMEVGRTLQRPWQPRLAAQYYWASGDRNPNDQRFEQFERLFGGHRADLGNTSLHGPLTPTNLSAPGLRLSVAPGIRTDARLTWSAAYLASASDRWDSAGLQDPSGGSGRFLGHAVDARARLWSPTRRVAVEVGASAFLHGSFSRKVPGGPDPRQTLFGYSQVAWTW